MIIFENAEQKIRAFNSYPDRPRESYHRVLTARQRERSFVQQNGNVSDENLYLIDRALRSYFMMNRGNRMGTTEGFVSKLGNILRNNEINGILARLREVTIIAPNLQQYKPDAKRLYESLSKSEHGLSADGTHFCVGATKVMHCLFPELFVMLDQNVGKAVGYRPSQYNNFESYWNVMDICRKELKEWQEIHNDTNSLLQLDTPPTTLPRIFDKCASIMGIWLKSAQSNRKRKSIKGADTEKGQKLQMLEPSQPNILSIEGDAMIKGTVTSQGKYADKKDICELYISADSSNRLPHKYGKRKPIDLRIGEFIYEAGVHETQNGVVWISSVLFRKELGTEKTRLVDALTEINVRKGDKIRIKSKEEGIFVFEKI
ncbi:MAG: hypothetical protein AB1638_13085 [Nitrospirota bacterium]